MRHNHKKTIKTTTRQKNAQSSHPLLKGWLAPYLIALDDIYPDTGGHGDTLVVWKLDRMGRSMSHLIEMIQKIEKEGVGFQSLTEKIDSTTAGGRLIFHLFGALAEFG